jgi:hypothetical protein
LWKSIETGRVHAGAQQQSPEQAGAGGKTLGESVTDGNYQLVHANLARMRAGWDDPIMAGFVERMDEIDALARERAGFVDQPTPADEGEVFAGLDLLNLSIWESVEDLEAFTYHGEHGRVMQRRAEWFEQSEAANYVLYWAPAGQIPTEAEVKRHLDYLLEHGPTPFAFTFECAFTAEESAAFDPGEV